MKIKNAKVCKVYIVWEQGEDSSFFKKNLDEDEITHLFLMAHHKHKNSEVSDSDSCSIPLYNELSNYFHEIHVETLSDFKKITIEIKIILKLKEEILKHRCVLESLKKDQASLENDKLCSLHTIEEKVELVYLS